MLFKCSFNFLQIFLRICLKLDFHLIIVIQVILVVMIGRFSLLELLLIFHALIKILFGFFIQFLLLSLWQDLKHLFSKQT